MRNRSDLSDQEMAALIEQLRNPKLRVGDNRKAQRRLCRWPAVILRPERENLSCIVEDISLGGCRVAVTGSRIVLGETVVVDIPTQKMVLDGTVIWKRDREAGIEFRYTEASYKKHD